MTALVRAKSVFPAFAAIRVRPAQARLYAALCQDPLARELARREILQVSHEPVPARKPAAVMMSALLQEMSDKAHGCSSALETERSLLLAVCAAIPKQENSDRLRLLFEHPVRWQVLFDLAGRHGVQPLLCQALAGVHDAVPPDELSSLMRSYQINLHKALLLSRELIRIVERLSADDIEVLPHKGLALAEVIYGDIALRQSGDIDLLIRPQDASRIRDAVGELGYTPHLTLAAPEQRAYLKSGYEFAFDGAAGPNLLEVQWAIQPRFYSIDFDMDGLFQRAADVTV